ncbi:hypothetical protein BDR22DRAFT_378095 [Usnea florida]
MAPSTDLMSRHPILPSGFAALPREIRDLVFSYVASAAHLFIDYHDNYLLHTGSKEYVQCIKVLHDWAARSYIAKGACEVLWSSDHFNFSYNIFNNRGYNHGWYSDTYTIIDPHHTLYLEYYKDGEFINKAVGNPVDLSMCVTKLCLYTNPNPCNLADPADYDTESLLKLKQELSQLHQFPRLRRLDIEISIPQASDAYHQGMTVVESISDACKEIKARIGTGLTISLMRAWPYDINEFEYIEEYDISWMWEEPNQMHRERVREWVATADEGIRVLIADGVDVKGEYTLLEELRYAASYLPQTKDEVVQMDVWEPWTGIKEQYWQTLKEEWRM